MSKKKRKKNKHKHTRKAQSQVVNLDHDVTENKSQDSELDSKPKQPRESQVLSLDKNTLREMYGTGGKRVTISVNEDVWQKAKTFTAEHELTLGLYVTVLIDSHLASCNV